MRRCAPFALLSVAAVLLAGCAGTTGSQKAADAKAALERAPVCCASLAEARREPLPRVPSEVPIDAQTSQAFDFGGNKAFFRLFELPPFSATYSVLLTSSASGSINDAALFIPRVAIYDAEFRVTRFFDEKTLRNRGNDLERTVFFNPPNANERYMAVYGSDLSATIERAYSMVTVSPIVAGPVIVNIVSGVDGKSVLRSAAAGMLLIDVQGLPPARR